MSGSSSEGVYRGSFRTDNEAKTPKGVRVVSGQRIDASILPIIDAQLDDLFAIASAAPYNYSGFSTHAAYMVAVFPRSNLCQEPAFLIDATGSPYEGSEWDKDPSPTRCLLCAAGLTFRNGASPNSVGSPGMVVTADGIKSTPIVRYEGEHNLLVEVDREKFNATQYHTGTNGGHPILPSPTTGQLVSRPEFPVAKGGEFFGQRVLIVK